MCAESSSTPRKHAGAVYCCRQSDGPAFEPCCAAQVAAAAAATATTNIRHSATTTAHCTDSATPIATRRSSAQTNTASTTTVDICGSGKHDTADYGEDNVTHHRTSNSSGVHRAMVVAVIHPESDERRDSIDTVRRRSLGPVWIQQTAVEICIRLTAVTGMVEMGGHDCTTKQCVGSKRICFDIGNIRQVRPGFHLRYRSSVCELVHASHIYGDCNASDWWIRP